MKRSTRSVHVVALTVHYNSNDGKKVVIENREETREKKLIAHSPLIYCLTKNKHQQKKQKNKFLGTSL